MRFALVVAVAALSALATAPGAMRAQAETPRDVAGRWTGQCSNCPVRRFVLVLQQDGDRLAGTLQAVGRSGLGEREMPLVSGRIAGRTVTFRVIGADGIALDSRLAISGDGKTMEGEGRHRAAFGLSFARADR